MPKLNQIVAVVQGKKSRTMKLLTEVHRGWAPEATSGIVRAYTPKDEEGDRLPTETKVVHLDVSAKIKDVLGLLANFWDVVATQESGNTIATADVVVDGMTLVNDLPITVLLFLDKQLTDLHTFVKQLPVLPPDREWTWDANRNCYVTPVVDTLKTQKTQEIVVKYPATPEHPAQTELVPKDVVIGTYATTYMSSAVPAQAVKASLAKIDLLQDAVKTARETANAIEVETKKIGAAILEYALSDVNERVQS